MRRRAAEAVDGVGHRAAGRREMFPRRSVEASPAAFPVSKRVKEVEDVVGAPPEQWHWIDLKWTRVSKHA